MKESELSPTQRNTLHQLRGTPVTANLTPEQMEAELIDRGIKVGVFVTDGKNLIGEVVHMGLGVKQHSKFTHVRETPHFYVSLRRIIRKGEHVTKLNYNSALNLQPIQLGK